MSNIKDDSLIDNTNIGEFFNDPLGGLSRMFDSFFDSDQFNGETDFRAVVISNPKSISAHEYEALGYAGSASRMSQQYKKFKVRITNKQNNPHAVLQDPCDLTLAADRCAQNALISAHTTVVTDEVVGLNIGAYVTIRLSKNTNGTYNLQNAHLLKMHHPNATGNTQLTARACKSVKVYFKHGESYTPPPAIEMPSEIQYLADMYDARSDVPNKTNHAPFINGSTNSAEDGNRSVNPVMVKWVKALLYRAWKDKAITVTLTDGLRKESDQQRYYDEWLARGRTGIPASKPPSGQHIPGFAIDLKFTTPDGTVYQGTDQSPAEWLSTGFPQIAEGPPLFMRWGGRWQGNQYDPIHFEIRPKNWSQAMLNQVADGAPIDTVTSGSYTEDQIDSMTSSQDASDSTPAEVMDAADTAYSADLPESTSE